jgi:hypothetical protein
LDLGGDALQRSLNDLAYEEANITGLGDALPAHVVDDFVNNVSARIDNASAAIEGLDLDLGALDDISFQNVDLSGIDMNSLNASINASLPRVDPFMAAGAAQAVRDERAPVSARDDMSFGPDVSMLGADAEMDAGGMDMDMDMSVNVTNMGDITSKLDKTAMVERDLLVVPSPTSAEPLATTTTSPSTHPHPPPARA